MSFRKSSYTQTETFDGKHRFEHWYRDNTVYFITSRVRDGVHAFATWEAKSIFWDRFDHWTAHFGFEPWVTTLMVNHYHTLGYLLKGENLGPMMQHLYGSIAKLVNDHLPQRHIPFWRTAGNKDYFDGCIRDVLQASRAGRYTLQQSVRARIVRDYRDYPDTRLSVDLDERIHWAAERRAFLEHIPYARYDGHPRARRGRLSDHA